MDSAIIYNSSEAKVSIDLDPDLDFDDIVVNDVVSSEVDIESGGVMSAPIHEDDILAFGVNEDNVPTLLVRLASDLDNKIKSLAKLWHEILNSTVPQIGRLDAVAEIKSSPRISTSKKLKDIIFDGHFGIVGFQKNSSSIWTAFH